MTAPNALPDILARALWRQDDFARALFARSESLSAFLPYEEYLDGFGIFRQKDGSLGVVYEAELCEHETKTSQEVVTLLEGLRSWFRLSDELTLSILFDQAQVSDHDPLWEHFVTSADRDRGDLAAALHLASLKRVQAARPMRRRLILSIRSFPRREGRDCRYFATPEERLGRG